MSRHRFTPLVYRKARRTPCASLLLSAAAVFVFCVPSVGNLLQYDRAAIAAGELWRLFTGHWVHYSRDHFLWDALAFAFLSVACEQKGRSRLLVCVIGSALVISLTVWVCLPGMRAYRGLSGVDSALFTLLFVDVWREAIRSRQPGQVGVAGACLAGFLLKISYELTTGGTVFVEGLGPGTVAVPLAHIAGATVGLLVGLLMAAHGDDEGHENTKTRNNLWNSFVINW